MYKRLTKEYQYDCNLCKGRQCTTDRFCVDRVDCNLYNRLAELEDLIENGTLIDTKVKQGQRVYMRGFWKDDFDEYIVSNILLENGILEIHLKHDFDEGKTCYSATVIGIDEIGKTVFLTKSEAKLKELKIGEV